MNKQLALRIIRVVILFGIIGIPLLMWQNTQQFWVAEEQGMLVVRMPVEGTLHMPVLGTCKKCTFTFAVYSLDLSDTAKQELAVLTQFPPRRRLVSAVNWQVKGQSFEADTWQNYRYGYDGKRHEVTDDERAVLDNALTAALEEANRFLAARDLLSRKPPGA